MSEANKYVDMSAVEALKLAKNHFLLLPDIQREYVWNMDDIEKLFESIVDGYPIGSCIFWKANKKVLNESKPNLYYFITKYKKDETKNEKAAEVFGEDGEYYIVLDGQQRITSLNIALYGDYTSYRGGRGHAKNDPKNWIKRQIYYNLDYHTLVNSEEYDDEKPPKRFVFLTEKEAEEGHYYKLNQLLKYDKTTNLIRDLIDEKYDECTQDDLEKLYSRLNSSSTDGVIHYYSISENTYDEALDIFVRVNSTGKKLSKSDLLFSTLIDGWKDGKENIENLLESVNCKGDKFLFTRDYLMRLLLVLADAPTNLKIESFKTNVIQKIRNNWKSMENAFGKMVDVLVEIGLSDAYLTSYNATMPLAYYIYSGGSIVTDEDKKEVKKFLSISMAKRLFGVASNDALAKTRNEMKKLNCRKTYFSLKIFEKIVLVGNRTFTVNDGDIEYWLDNYVIGKNSYILLALLYPNLKLNQMSFHQDHCHPYVSFNTKNIVNIGLDDEKIKEWQFKRNLLPNLQFLEGRENESKNKTPLKEWLDEGNTIKFCPNGISFELENFDDFFAKRKELMKEELNKIFKC